MRSDCTVVMCQAEVGLLALPVEEFRTIEETFERQARGKFHGQATAPDPRPQIDQR